MTRTIIFTCDRCGRKSDNMGSVELRGHGAACALDLCVSCIGEVLTYLHERICSGCGQAAPRISEGLCDMCIKS